MADIERWVGAALPDDVIEWRDDDGDLIDLTAYTFDEIRVGQIGEAPAFTKTTGVTFAASSPNITIAWPASGEVVALAVGFYSLTLVANRASDSKPRILQLDLLVKDVVAAA